MNIDRTKIAYAAQNGIPLVIRTHTLPPATEFDLEEILLVFLAQLGQTDLKDHLSYCLRELTGNAKKANTKRVYFEEKGLDITNPVDYALGMASFKADTLSSIHRYLELQVQKDLYLKVTFLIRNQVLYLSVKNNAAVTQVEMARVVDRVTQAWAYGSMEEAFDAVLDDSEGAGLGLGILILMLRKLSLGEKSFEFTCVGGETIATLRIPMKQVQVDRINEVADKIAEVVESLPPFPENLQRLLRLLDDPEVAFGDLAAQLAHDPAMTADLIKYINSASNRGKKKIEDLEEAIRIVGLQGLKDLMYPYGAHKILKRYLAKQRHLWDNATTVSRYSVDMAREFRFDWNEKGRAQIAGLLYNLGQIVVTFLHPELSSKILEFCRLKGFSVEAFDDVTQSINPSDLGARIAEKWNFPEDLVQILRHQGQPEAAPEALRPVTAAVHLAASLRSLEMDLLTYSQIDSDTLVPLGLDAAKVKELHLKLKASVEAQVWAD